jgi:hypothetical protein
MPFGQDRSGALRRPDKDRDISRVHLTLSRFEGDSSQTLSGIKPSTRLFLAATVLALVLVFVYFGPDLVGPIVYGR